MKPSTTGTPQFVRLSAQAATAELRTEVYKGEEHLIVPVVALVGDIVTTGMLSDGPEFIPSDVLAAAPSGWNGRPILAAHPLTPAGANEPSTWSERVFGQIFHADFSDGRLRVEAYLNREQAERAGEDAAEVLTKIQAGETVEVSVGAWVWMDDLAGVAPDGSTYESVWRACVPDHLAMGLQTQGGKGACDASMGCGAPRVLAAGSGLRVLSAKQAEAIKEKVDMSHRTLLHRLAEKLGADEFAALAEGMSDSQLRQKLNKALRATVPAFWGVEAIYMDSSTAIYAAMPGDSVEFYECSFTVEGDNVSIGRRKRVEPVTRWEKVAAVDGSTTTDDKAELKSECKCQDHGASNADGSQAAQQGTKGASMTDKVKELVGRLTANAATKLTDADVEKLSALSEEQLTALVELVEKPAVEVVKEAPIDPNLIVFSKDEATQMRRALAREQEREKAHRGALVKALVGAGVKYTEAQLNAKETGDLEQLADTLGLLDDNANTNAPDFSGRGLLAAVRSNAEDGGGADDYAPPDPYGLPAAVAKSLGYRTAAQ